MPETFSSLFGFALGVTGPTFLWVMGGLFLYRRGWLRDAWLKEISNFVFRIGLPVVLFFGAVRVDYRQLLNTGYLTAGALATLLVLVFSSLYGQLRGFPPEDRVIFVQAAYRGNLGVVGIALCSAAYGEEGLALAAPAVAILTIAYNMVAVVLLNRVFGAANSRWKWLADVAKNPLVIGVALGGVVSLLGIEIPFHVRQSGAIFSAGLLPMALLCIGASLNLRTLRSSGALTVEACLWKLLLVPLIGVAIAMAMNVHSAELGVLFLLLASPVAAASYIMVMAAGGNGALAANIVVLSTLLSSLSLTLGLALLQQLGWV